MILLYVLLCIVSVILITLVLMQDSKSGLGGLTGGSTMSSFGANTDKFLIKITGGAGAIFFILVVCIHLGNKNDAGQKSLMPASAETKTDAPAKDSKASEKAPKEATKDASKEASKAATETKGTSVVVPIKDAKEAPATEAKPEVKITPAAPAEPEKK
jgi:protein translocase SecG subunit